MPLALNRWDFFWRGLDQSKSAWSFIFRDGKTQFSAIVPSLKKNQDGMGAYTSASWLWMRRDSKKWYFSGYPSVQIPLLFFFSVTDEILTLSPEVCYSLSQNNIVGTLCHLHREFALDNKESHISVIAVIC